MIYKTLHRKVKTEQQDPHFSQKRRLEGLSGELVAQSLLFCEVFCNIVCDLQNTSVFTKVKSFVATSLCLCPRFKWTKDNSCSVKLLCEVF